MPKSKDSQVSLEEFGKSTFSCSDYLIFLDNPQLLGSSLNVVGKY